MFDSIDFEILFFNSVTNPTKSALLAFMEEKKMLAYADANEWKGGDFKKLNLPFESHLLSQPASVRDRRVKAVENIVFTLLTDVFNATDTADQVKNIILKTQSHFPESSAEKIEDKNEWTREKIFDKASKIVVDKGPDGNFDD